MTNRPRQVRALLLATLLMLGAGCSLNDLVNSDELPKDVNDPALTETPAGARQAYSGAVSQFILAFGQGRGGDQGSFVATSGVLSDELMWPAADPIDQRVMPENTTSAPVYDRLQKVRGHAYQARGLLATYLADQPALAGHLYALQGYAEIFLADLFCSGVPLSTLDYNGDFTYQPGSSTAQIYTHAIGLFDTAITLAADSERFVRLAQVGRARAFLGLGSYADAAAAAAAVPDDYRYDVPYSASTTTVANGGLVRWTDFASFGNDGTWGYTVPDREGSNGLDWVSANDPRVRLTSISSYENSTTGNIPIPLYHPDKYATDGSTPIVLASGVEARLIEAEAALQAGDVDGWLGKLNRLRETAIVPAMPDTTDPGTATARVDLLFRERAFWLFLTGHRQGDLRRLIRQYGRSEGTVYPVGSYAPNVVFPYGSDITIPVSPSEFANPLFTGCASRGA